MTRRIFLDTEWTGPPWSERSALMWIGLADEQGRAWYGISSEVSIDPSTNDFMAGVFRVITPEEPRLPRARMAAAVVDFCGDVDEFWAWIPTRERFAEWFGLGDEAAELYAKSRDVDLRMLRALVQPWPAGWPDHLLDLNAAAAAAGVETPPRAANPLHPRVHAEWNRQLFERLRAASARIATRDPRDPRSGHRVDRAMPAGDHGRKTVGAAQPGAAARPAAACLRTREPPEAGGARGRRRRAPS